MIDNLISLNNLKPMLHRQFHHSQWIEGWITTITRTNIKTKNKSVCWWWREFSSYCVGGKIFKVQLYVSQPKKVALLLTPLRGLKRQFHSANFFIHHFWLCLLDSGIACLMMECLKSTFTTKSHLKKVFFTEKATLSSTIFWYFLCTFVDFCRILLACKIVLEFVWFACTCVEQVDFAAWVFTFLSARCSWCKWEDVRTVSWPARGPGVSLH